MSPLTKVEQATNERDALEAMITTVESQVAANAGAPLAEAVVDNYLQECSRWKTQLEDIHRTIMHATKVDIAIHNASYVSLTTRIITLASNLKMIKNGFPVTTHPHSSSSCGHTAAPVQPVLKLPALGLPKFSGNYEDWQSFSDLFLATVQSNGSLSGSQKLQYLKTCLEGEAGDLIKSFTVTDLHYQEAWDLLVSRYKNEREIVHSLCRKFYLQPAVRSESAAQIQTLLNTTLECIRSLKVMQRKVEEWEDLIIIIILEKLDPDTRADWAKQLQGTTPTTFAELQTFLEQRIRSLHARGTQSLSNKQQQNRATNKVNVHHGAVTTNSCKLCSEHHFVYQCNKFINMSPEERNLHIKNTGACFNCLREHPQKPCSSRSNCKKCNKRHNTMLHFSRGTRFQGQQQQAQHSQVSQNPNSSQPQVARSNACSATQQTQVILKTALVDIYDSFNNKHQCRILIDDASEVSLITEKCAIALGLHRERANVIITGISAIKANTAQQKSTVRLHSKVHTAAIDVEVLILPKVTGDIPRLPCDISTWGHIEGIKLADPNFNQPGEVDILVGADVVPGILREGIKSGAKLTATAQNSIFGWLLFGKVSPITQSIVRSFYTTTSLEDIMKRFWEVEEVQRTNMTKEEQEVEDHFKATHSRAEDGRYIVRLPFNEKKPEIGESRQQALRRLQHLERRFQRQPQQKEEYQRFIHEYETLGHMTKLTATAEAAFYLPHHYVLKEDSTTTKLRVVFDASAKSSTGVSLNDALKVGPTIQSDVFTALLRFRFHVVALKADIAKMYRQFLVHPEDASYQTILWRDEPHLPVQEFRLNTLTYGTSPAAFCAVRCLASLAEEEASQFPLASPVLKKEVYVDDLASGAPTINSAQLLVKELCELVQKGGMQFRKWCSNDPLALKNLPPELKDDAATLSFDEDGTTKALGIVWKPAEDSFLFKVAISTAATTKRQLLSELARVFDPIGLLAPITINAKLLLQELWRIKVNWDEKLTTDLQDKWQQHQQEMKQISELRIPRCVVYEGVINYQVHGFSDASEKAYAACIYLRAELPTGDIQVNLITAKSKVAPLQQLTLPKLELCGMVLLAELVESIRESINFDFTLHCWTDSTVALKWITASSRRWKTFVANRVSIIQGHVPPEHWKHVAGTSNPADLPSRGIAPADLINCDMWWHGPEFLREKSLPISTYLPDMFEVAKEERHVILQSLVVQEGSSTTDTLLKYFSSFRKLTRAVQYFTKFAEYLKYKQVNSKLIQTFELKATQQRLYRFVQACELQEDRKCLQQNKQVPKSSKLNKLNPFLDDHGVVRVGGRLKSSNLPYQAKFPVVLPRHHLTDMIILQCHQDTLHGGFSIVLATLRREFWIIGGRDRIRHLIQKCVTCRRVKPAEVEQQMGNLPSPRVTPSRPFLHTSVDFCGPFLTRQRRGRGIKCDKTYVVVFVCFAVKALHLEWVSDLSADSFIATFRRFTARRGVPSHLYSDQATNFTSTATQLNSWMQSEFQLQQKMTSYGTQFVFHTPSSPHRGGIHESAVKSTKFHLKRVAGNASLTLEQFATLLCNVEAVLNSRPLCPLSPDPTDFEALTPGHFLIGTPLISVPDPAVLHVPDNRLDHWQYVQKLSQDFWKRWSTEYLLNLHQRYKWTSPKPNVRVDDLVLIKEDNLPPMKWRLGRIVSTFPGSDGLVRTVKLRTSTGYLERPIQKLSPLFSHNEV